MRNVAFVLSFLPIAPALAQDFGVEWADRVTHELQQARGPLTAKPVQAKVALGLSYYYDTNTFLEEDNRDANAVLIPFIRGRVDYAEPQLEAAADLLASYKRYIQDEQVSADEERFFGRLRYAGSRVSLELAEIVRHENDPLDAVFASRAQRFVIDTVPRVEVDFNRWFGLEASADVQDVVFREDVFRQADNLNLRADLAGVFHASNGYDFIGQVGYLQIDYTRGTGPPDVVGGYARLGLRGELLPRLLVEALAGYTQAESDDLPATGEKVKARTGDASVHVRYEAMQTLTVYADYTRLIGFAGLGDPFQTVNRWVGIGEYQVSPQVGLRGRLQYDHVDTSLGTERTFFSAGASTSYKYNQYFTFEAGITYRRGDINLPGGDFDDLVLHVGLVATN